MWTAKALRSSVQARAIVVSRSYTSRSPLPDKPRLKVSDPLTNNPHATYIELPENLTFIHRPPPSLPSPESLTTSPASPLLRPPLDLSVSWTDPSLPPVSRPSLIDKDGPPPRLSDEQIEEMRSLRAQDPKKWSRNRLAAKFDCTPYYVSMAAPLKKSDWKVKIKKMEAEHNVVRSRWGERKTLFNKIRAKRREYW